MCRREMAEYPSSSCRMAAAVSVAWRTPGLASCDQRDTGGVDPWMGRQEREGPVHVVHLPGATQLCLGPEVLDPAAGEAVDNKHGHALWMGGFARRRAGPPGRD